MEFIAKSNFPNHSLTRQIRAKYTVVSEELTKCFHKVITKVEKTQWVI